MPLVSSLHVNVEAQVLRAVALTTLAYILKESHASNKTSGQLRGLIDMQVYFSLLWFDVFPRVHMLEV